MRLRDFLLNVLVLASAPVVRAAVRIVPTPQYVEFTNQPLLIASGSEITIVLGPAKPEESGKRDIAAQFLKTALQQADASLKVDLESPAASTRTRFRIYLWNYRGNPNPSVELSFLDREVLTSPSHFGQSYIIRPQGETSLWVVGSTEEGLLLGAMSVLQMIQKGSTGIEISRAYVRDYPDFRYRAAANWLLRIEVNRWSLDWGRGEDAYRHLCEQKLDEALRFKINMVVFDGFGWGLKQRFDGYANMMKSLNQYARARGIHLVYGGYGARYGLSDKGFYAGEIWKNRAIYPDGTTYECMGSDKGTCRANEHLNRLKVEELRKYVETVEPGALYIHHEDVGLNEFASMWRTRDALCRKRWPNDSVTEVDGGVGALAHLDSELIEAINGVKNADGYEAARDCVIILVSPGYGPDSISSADWSNTLEFWTKYAGQLPASTNTLFCFGGSSISSIFPQKYGGSTWIATFNALMARQGSHIGSYVFFAGGAENYYSDYPLSGTPALNAMFDGATGIYNASGNFYNEPMEIVNAEYSWNRHSDGFFREPLTFDEAMRLNLNYIFAKNQPSELFGSGGIYDRALELLYGAKAAAAMKVYYDTSAWVPDNGTSDTGASSAAKYLRSSHVLPDPLTASQEQEISAKGDYLPMMWGRAYAIPRYWRDLEIDSISWKTTIEDAAYAADMARLHIDTRELHRRLAHQWEVLAGLNLKGASEVATALRAGPLAESVPGLQFLLVSFKVDQPLLEALVSYHRGKGALLASPADRSAAEIDLRNALAAAQRARDLAAQEFPHPIDPSHGEVGAIRDYSARLVQSIERELGEKENVNSGSVPLSR